MDRKLLLLTFVGVQLVAFCAGYPRKLDEDELAAPAFARAIRERRGWLDCKAPGEKCSGFPPCCGDNSVCFWENGFSLRTSGRCVECVDRGQVCQRDAQCCDPLVCQKTQTYQANGICDVKLPIGADCHDNDQCESEFCNIHWYNDIVMGHGGKCDTPVTR